MTVHVFLRMVRYSILLNRCLWYFLLNFSVVKHGKNRIWRQMNILFIVDNVYFSNLFRAGQKAPVSPQ